MKALLLAGGQGTRLRPFTDDRPKPMVEIGGEPAIAHALRWLGRQGVTEVAINLHAHPDVLRAYVADGARFGLHVTYSFEPQILGTSGALRPLYDFFRAEEAFVVLYGDVLTDLDLGPVRRAHTASGADATLVLTRVDDPTRAGIVAFDHDHRIARLVEKPAADAVFSAWANAGIYYCGPTVLQYVAAHGAQDFARDLFPAMLRDGRHLLASPTSALVIDFGSPERLELARTAVGRAQGGDVLIARAPLRISFAGGGTDLEAYYAKHGGVVVSVTINKYFYVFLSRTSDDAVQITSSDFRAFERQAAGEALSSEGDLGYLKTILHEFGVRRGLAVFTASEIPPGTGLGSSSTVAVALVKALATLCQRRASKQETAELASYIEIVKLGRPIGLQDQFATSFGGLNVIHFESTGTTVTPMRLPLDVRSRLEQRILLFFTGSSRNAATILTEQRHASANDDPRVIENLHGIKRDALEVRQALEEGRLRRVGEILHESWQRKKQLARGVSTERIDRLYQLALEHGVVGGKIAGAGGGGFLLLYCEPENQDEVTRVLEAEGLARLGFHFDDGGAQVLVNSMPEVPGLTYPEGRWIVTGATSA